MEAYVEEMKAFVNCVQQDIPLPVTGRDGRVSVVMGLAAKKSYDEHRPVYVSEIGASV